MTPQGSCGKRRATTCLFWITVILSAPPLGFAFWLVQDTWRELQTVGRDGLEVLGYFLAALFGVPPALSLIVVAIGRHQRDRRPRLALALACGAFFILLVAALWVAPLFLG